MTKAIVIALFTAAALLPASGFAGSTVPATYEEATALYQDGRYMDAISALAIAAEDGDVRAQRLLGLMYVYGESLYGPAVHRDVGLGRAWLYRASAQGDKDAAWTLARLDRGQPLPHEIAVLQHDASGE